MLPSMPFDVAYEVTKLSTHTPGRVGGYVFVGVHNVPGDTPESHLRAMLEAYRNARAYLPGQDN